MNVRILKAAAQIITPFLKTAFNKCIFEGVFPESMKIAKVFRFLKTEKKMKHPTKYRFRSWEIYQRY